MFAGSVMLGPNHRIDLPDKHNKHRQPFPGEKRSFHSILHPERLIVSDNRDNVDRGEVVYVEGDNKSQVKIC